MRLFVYGELCRPHVLREQLERLPAARPAIAIDHRKRRADSGYFELVAEPGAHCAGLLLQDIRGAEITTLDRFEGVQTGAYERRRIRVRTIGESAEDREVSAYTAPVRDEP